MLTDLSYYFSDDQPQLLRFTRALVSRIMDDDEGLAGHVTDKLDGQGGNPWAGHLSVLLCRCLERQPECRPSAKEVVQRLLHILAEEEEEGEGAQ